ncbi:hypothetical protein AHMF7605_00505 [Adhaeribacter arboris]|uniref:DUF4279 domain-containing protein n=1 Tax=Adhaeribacter arboris TaxID=2072846 RepID=A0A2T2Y9D7_9BACT|nr:DUF4279 domain-containing protein [Adhaeribacter arboris]PSR52106.1 hypothetical protein AHMF7605_00505 [Adhaeribacter arboris]
MIEIDTHKVSLKFFDFDCPPDELTKELGLEPTRTALKGQEYYIGPENKRVKKTWKWNFWEHQITIVEKDVWIGDLIDNYIDKVFQPRQENIKKITSKCRSEFSIVQYLYDGCNPGLHFKNNRLKIIADIGAEIDIDIYMLGSEQIENKEKEE